MSEGNLGLVGAGIGVLALAVAGVLVLGMEMDREVKALQTQIKDHETTSQLNDVRHDTQIESLQGQHDAAIDYLLDKHAAHEKEIASLKKRLSKKPIVKPVVHRWHVYQDPHCVPYDQPTSH
jgi:uncharacterized protein HemX